MAFGGFVDEFTNSPVQPAFSTYLGLNLTGNIALDWSQFTLTALNPFSQLIIVTSNTATTNTIFMPDATLSSVQQTVILGNSSATAYNVSDFDGNPLGIITAGEVWFYALTDNTTQAGIWFLAQFGGTIQPGDAAALVGDGYGLIAEAGLIKLNFLTIPITITDVPYNLTNTGRGRFHLWLAGNDAFNLPAANTVSNGFVFSIANQSGVVGGIANVTPNGINTINGEAAPIEIKKNESTFLICDGVNNWTTLARNQVFAQNFAQQTTPINAVSTTLTAKEANPELQKFINGSFSGAATVIFPVAVPEFYIMWNARSAGNNITVQNEGSGLMYLLLPGETIALYSDGIDLHPIANIFLSANGTAVNPAITFENDTALGWYRVADNTAGFTAGGVQRLQFDNNGLNVTLSADNHTPTISPIGTPSTGVSFPSTTSMAYSVGGVNIFEIDNTDFNIMVPVTIPVGTETDPSYSFNLHADSGMWYDTATPALAFSFAGIKRLSLSATDISFNYPILVPASSDSSSPTFSFIGYPTWGMNFHEPNILNLITAGASALQINGAQLVSLTNPLGATSGGTAHNTYAIGDMLYANAIDSLATLPISATAGKALVSNPDGAIPIWGGLSILQIQPVTQPAILLEGHNYNYVTFTDIPGFTATITTTSANSFIAIMMNGNFDVVINQVLFLRLMRNGTPIYINSDLSPTPSTTSVSGGSAAELKNINIFFIDQSPPAGVITYTLQGQATAAGDFNVNQNYAATEKGASSFYVIEIGGL